MTNFFHIFQNAFFFYLTEMHSVLDLCICVNYTLSSNNKLPESSLFYTFTSTNVQYSIAHHYLGVFIWERTAVKHGLIWSLFDFCHKLTRILIWNSALLIMISCPAVLLWQNYFSSVNCLLNQSVFFPPMGRSIISFLGPFSKQRARLHPTEDGFPQPWKEEVVHWLLSAALIGLQRCL